MNKIKFTGIMPALITPLNKNGEVNAAAVKDIMDDSYNAGVNGFYTVGGTGEGVLLSVAQRKAMAEAAVAANGGRGKIIIHTGSINSDEVMELTRHATEIGADGVSSVPPSFYFKYTLDETVDFYKKMADNTDLPLIVYANNQTAGVDVNAMMERLMSVPNICGAKDTRSNYYQMWQLKRINNGNINVINGPDESLLCGLISGADGGIGATYGVMPELFVELYNAFKAGDIDHARAVQSKINVVIQILIKYCTCSVVTTVKAWYQLRGFDVDSGCYPSRPMDGEKLEAFKNDMIAAGVKL